MSAQDLTRAVRNPGRLALAPTSVALGSSYPYGGTELGWTSGLKLRWGLGYSDVIAEEWGSVVKSQRVVEIPIFVCVLEQWDDAFIQAVFPKVTSAGSPSGLSDIKRIDGGAQPGDVSVWQPLLFAPDDEDQKAIYIPCPIPKVEVQAALSLALGDARVIPLAFTCARDSNGRAYQCDRIDHLVIP